MKQGAKELHMSVAYNYRMFFSSSFRTLIRVRITNIYRNIKIKQIEDMGWFSRGKKKYYLALSVAFNFNIAALLLRNVIPDQ
jgi:hypothetical protein